MATAERISPPVQESLVATRTSKPVVAWAVLGGFFLVLQAYIYISWLLSAKPTPPGPTPMPTYMSIALQAWQWGGIVVLVVFLYYFLYRPWRRTGQLTTDGMLCIAIFSVTWQDPLSDWSTMWFTYNANFVNLGGWGAQIPGAITPNLERNPEPLLWIFPVYIYLGLGACIVANVGMRKIKERRPHISNWALFGILLVSLAVLDLIVEPMFMYLGLYQYTGAMESWSIFAGHYYAFPVYESVLLAGAWGSWAALRFFKNDKGQTFAERGIDEVNATSRGKAVIRLLALIGAVNLIYLVLYNAPIQFLNLHGGPYPSDVQTRSYFVNERCGPGTTYACPAPNVPVPKRTSSHVAPDGSLVGAP